MNKWALHKLWLSPTTCNSDLIRPCIYKSYPRPHVPYLQTRTAFRQPLPAVAKHKQSKIQSTQNHQLDTVSPQKKRNNNASLHNVITHLRQKLVVTLAVAYSIVHQLVDEKMSETGVVAHYPQRSVEWPMV